MAWVPVDKLSVVYVPIKHSFLTSKILIDSPHGIAIAYAGSPISETVARSLLSEPSLVKERLSEGNLESFASDICNQDELKQDGWHGELLIVSQDDLAPAP